MTTRSDRKKVNIDDFSNFWKNIRDNVEGSAEFKRNLESGYLQEKFEKINNPVDLMEQLESPYFEKLFGLFIGKWLLGIMKSQKWTVKLRDSYWYRTKSAGYSDPNMLSLAFLFTPLDVCVDDPTGLAETVSPISPEIDEASQAVGIIEGMNQLNDIDQYLYENNDTFKESISQSEELLRKAGYNTSSYREWAVSVLPEVFQQSIV